MTANKKRLIINLFLILGVALLIWFVMQADPESKDKAETLFDQSMGDDVTEVILHIEGQADIQIENRGKGENRQWQITQPVQHEADEVDKDKVRLLFTVLTDPVLSSYDAAGKDLEKYGLGKDSMSISFNGVKLILGDFNPISNARYILKGDKIYLINETISGMISMGVDGFKKFKPNTAASDND